MRIAFFTESFTPLINGVSTSVETLLAELDRRGHTAYVITSRYPGYDDPRTNVFRFPSINAVVEPHYYIPVPFSPKISATIARLKLDLVHSQSPFLLGRMARSVARRYGIPLVSTNHTLYAEYLHYFPFLPPGVVRSRLVRLMKRYYNSCDAVIVPSEYTRRRLMSESQVSSPITVVPTGVPPSPYVLATRASVLGGLGIDKDAHVLLYVGRLAKEKNLEMLLDAFRTVSRTRSDSYLVVAGSGHHSNRMQRYAADLGVGSRCIFTGFLDRTRLDPLYKSADVFVFPSCTETQGLAVAEAMSAGLPTIVVNQGGASEAVADGEDGFVVPSDAAAFAARALALLDDAGLRERMGAAALKNSERLRPDRMAADVIAVYETVLGLRPKREAPAETERLSPGA